jgi:methyltransferase (TIGR00027 family)
MTHPPIANVSDTARWVAYYRAMETDRPDAIFRDPFARRLAGPQGEAIVRTLPGGTRWAWPMVVRTAVMDEIVLRCVADGADTIVNLAAGLDARPWRLALPADLRWVDVDFPAMLDYKTAQLAGEPPRCRYAARPADLADPGQRREALAAAAGPARRALVITEGLLVYLEAEQVAALARDLHRQPVLQWWLTDLASPQLLKFLAKSWGVNLARGNAPMKFAPAEGSAFFAPHGWREAEWRSTWEEARRLGRRMRFAWMLDLLTRFQSARKREAGRRFAGMLLLERI